MRILYSLLFLVLAVCPAQAGVVINGTRVIHEARDKESTVQLENRNEHPALVQAWIDGGDIDVAPDEADVPFILTPPIFRVEPGQSQSLRIKHTGAEMPQDTESLYWLNVLEVPPKPVKEEMEGRSYMQLAFRTRVKLFYRPNGLKVSPVQARRLLRVRMVKGAEGWSLSIDNPTPYHMSFSSIGVKTAAREYGKGAGIRGGGGMVAPQTSAQFPLDGYAGEEGARPSLILIDDYGATVPLDMPFSDAG